jgi:hypothetical protein
VRAIPSAPLILGIVVALAAGLAIGIASGLGSSGTNEPSDQITDFDYRAHAIAPPPRLKSILTVEGLELKASCQLANDLPVLEVGVTGSAAGSYAVHAGYQDDETDTQVLHAIPANQVNGILGPIGAGDGATGTLTYLPQVGRAITINFVAATKIGGADCAVGGTVIRGTTADQPVTARNTSR